MRPMGLLVILFDRELRCEFIQQIAMGTPSHGGAGQQSMSARTGILSANTMVFYSKIRQIIRSSLSTECCQKDRF